MSINPYPDHLLPSPEQPKALPEPVKEHLLTPANLMTLARPILGFKAMNMLRHGERGGAAVAAVAALTDREGDAARFVDKHWPESGRGSTSFGKLGDPIADSALAFELGAGVMMSPKVSKLSKFAVALTMIDEGQKSVWALRADRKHRKETGEKLVLEVTQDGKRGTAGKMVAGGLAAITGEMKPGKARNVVGGLSVAAAVGGIAFSRKARREYKRRLAK